MDIDDALAIPGPGARRPRRGRLRPRTTIDIERLEVYERKGDGHTLRRHCGVSPAIEADRLERHPALRASGSFIDRPTAQRAVEACVAACRDQVEAWPAARRRLAIGHEMHDVIGAVLTRDDLAAGRINPQPAHNVRVVLQRNPAYASGFAVLTAYPQLP